MSESDRSHASSEGKEAAKSQTPDRKSSGSEGSGQSMREKKKVQEESVNPEDFVNDGDDGQLHAGAIGLGPSRSSNCRGWSSLRCPEPSFSERFPEASHDDGQNKG